MHCETFSIENPDDATADVSERARKRMLSVRGEPLFFADWLNAVFVHYEAPVAELQRLVPFPLDLFQGKAYVSLVAFTMRDMRPCRGGRFSKWLFKAVASNDYLNVRAYVRHNGESGIYFLREWMNNPFSVRLGSITFGLPYHFGKFDYRNQPAAGYVCGSVCERTDGASFVYEAAMPDLPFLPCPARSLDEFLLERYTAFTAHKGTHRFFRIWHQPWSQQPVHVSVSRKRLLADAWPWFADAVPACANYSPGARDVWMGRPHKIVV